MLRSQTPVIESESSDEGKLAGLQTQVTNLQLQCDSQAAAIAELNVHVKTMVEQSLQLGKQHLSLTEQHLALTEEHVKLMREHQIIVKAYDLLITRIREGKPLPLSSESPLVDLSIFAMSAPSPRGGLNNGQEGLPDPVSKLDSPVAPCAN